MRARPYRAAAPLAIALAVVAAPVAAPGTAQRATAKGSASPAQSASGALVVRLIERPVGRERFTTVRSDSGITLTAALDVTDRGSPLHVDAEIRTTADATPVRFRAKGNSYRFVNVDIDARVDGAVAHVRSFDDTSTVPLAPRFTLARTYAPLSGRALLIRYWETHGRPPVIGGLDSPVAVAVRGADTIATAHGRTVLRRYAVNGVVWGRETVWLDSIGAIAAVVSRVHILPLEAVRTDLDAALPQLQASAIRDRVADIASLGREIRPIASGLVAITGARVINGLSAAPIEDAALVMRDGRIAAVGPRVAVTIPAGAQVLNARGTTIIPGLWDMHGHVSQIEWGPAYLAAGVTTVRDMGGEAAFLTAIRDAWAAGAGPGPSLALAGLIDGPGPLGFGATIAATPAEGAALVDAYRAMGFEQIKLYNSITAPVAGAVIARAHATGMTVTGHVPTAMGLRAIVDSGMDHVAHLPFRGNETAAALDSQVAHLKERGIVVDPTLPWNELLGRARGTHAVDVEPGLAYAPGPLRSNYESVHNATGADAVAGARAAELRVVKALHDAGVPVVAGTDGAVPGYSVLRSVELFVAAGFTPLEAVQAATIVSAAALRGVRGPGTLTVGAPADLLVLDGNPLDHIENVRRGRWVAKGGRIYECARLWEAAGFRRQAPVSLSPSAPPRESSPRLRTRTW